MTMGTGILTGRVFGFLQGIMLARLMGASELGKYAALLAVCGLISRLFDFGLPAAFSFYARKSGNSLGSLLKVLGLNTLFSCALSGLMVYGMGQLPIPIARELHRSFSSQFTVYAYLVVGVVANVLPVFLMASGNYGKYVTFFNLGVAIQIGIQYAFYFARGASFMNFFTANLLSQTVMAAILLVFLVRRAKSQAETTRVTAKDCYGFGIKAQWGVMMKLFSGQMELPILSSILSPVLVGHYSIANTFREAALMPQTFYSGIFQNLLIDKGMASDGSSQRTLLKGLIFQAAISVSITIFAALAFPFLIPKLYGASFHQAVGVSSLLVASTVFTGLSGLCWISFNSKGKPQLMGRVLTVSGLVSPVLIYTFSSIFGILGAGLASVGASFVTFGLSFLLAVKVNSLGSQDFSAAIREIRGFVLQLVRRN